MSLPPKIHIKRVGHFSDHCDPANNHLLAPYLLATTNIQLTIILRRSLDTQQQS